MAQAFTMRPLERNTRDSALEGAFRVHLAMIHLKSLKLSSGDLVSLSTPEGAKGFAIAWPASQTNPGNKPIAKVTDLLRDKYQLSLNDRLFIDKTEKSWTPITAVTLSHADGSPELLAKFGSKEELLHWSRNALVDLDIVFPGCTFDIQQKGTRVQPKSLKTPLLITSVEPPPDNSQPYYFDLLGTQIKFTGAESASEAITVPEQIKTLSLSSEGIGGMSSHIRTINEELKVLTMPKLSINPRLLGPTTFLIHGCEGNGKSLLLDRFSRCDWQQVITLAIAPTIKNYAKEIVDAFDRALTVQPSLIVMDDLDRLLAKTDSLPATLRAQLKRLEGTKVVVAAATRSLYDIDSSLRTTQGFGVNLELPPPNTSERAEIMKAIIGPDYPAPSLDYDVLAKRTHGFVGRDIFDLCSKARKYHVNKFVNALSENLPVNEMNEEGDLLEEEDFEAVFDQIQPTVLKGSILEVPKVQWTDIAGLDHVQEEMEAIITRPLKFPDLDLKFGERQQRNGVLLYGPPGCAKTLVAQAVATESNQNFLAVKGAELIKMYVGESERAIRDVFRRARAAKPCIIFFDEIDSIGKSREKTHDSGLNVVTTLLNEMDGIEALKDVFIIAATNRPDILDSALIRTGRFDAHIHIGLPTKDARRKIFEIHTRKRPLADDVDLNMLASKTDVYSGADIKGICKLAVDLAKADYIKAFDEDPNARAQIHMHHFERALERQPPHTIAEEAARYEKWRPGVSLFAD